MKKCLFVAAFIVAGIITSNAQTEKGTWLMGGDVSFQTSDGSNLFIARPSFGYFVARNFAIGGQLTAILQDGDNLWAVGPFVRGYFAGNEKGKFYGQLGLNVGGGSNSDTEVGFGLGAGYAIFLNRSIAINLGLNYDKTGDSNGIFGIGAGFQIHFKR